VLAVGPSAAAVGATRVGQACHITAAAEGGPRYDPTLTPALRRSYENGIWLCNVCARLIDAEVDAHPVSLLRDWKAKAEARVRSLIGKPLPRHEDAIAQVTMALTAAPERHIPGAIGNVHRAIEASLNALDPQIKVRSAYENGTTSYELHSDEPIRFSVSAPEPIRVTLNRALSQITQHGGEVTVPFDGATMHGSPVLELLVNSATTAGATLTVASIVKPAVQYTRFVDQTTQVVSSFPDIHGSITYGVRSFTYTGTACGGIVTFSYRYVMEDMPAPGQMNLATAFDAWHGVDVRHLPHFEAVHRLYERLSSGCTVEMSLEVAGLPILRATSGFGEEQSPSSSIHAVLEYVRLLREVATRFDAPLVFRTDHAVTHDEVRAVARAVETLRDRYSFGAADLSAPPTCTMTNVNAGVFRDAIAGGAPMVIRWREEKGELLEAFGQPIQLPPCEYMLLNVVPDVGTLDLEALRSGDSVTVTWKPLASFRCFRTFVSAKDTAEAEAELVA
jgi:hypothetical protein